MSEDAARRDGAARCPICRLPTAHAWRPFCSKRCADVDLARWLSGRYAIPGYERADEIALAPDVSAKRDGEGD